jgi:hypothetical protein
MLFIMIDLLILNGVFSSLVLVMYMYMQRSKALFVNSHEIKIYGRLPNIALIKLVLQLKKIRLPVSFQLFLYVFDIQELNFKAGVKK